jgi:hypothetical protein
VILAKLVTNAFTDRYAEPCRPGHHVLIAFAASRLTRRAAR